MSIRVVVVDGHTMTRYGLCGLAAAHPDLEVVGEATTMADARQLVADTRPDVVTIDVALPDGDGLRLARDLRDRHPDLGIVVLTAAGEDDVLFRALDTGASAFVHKTAPVDEVLGAIRHAAVAATSFTATGLVGALARQRTAPARGLLSTREHEVLGLLRDGLSIPEIARALFVSPSTAKTHVARIYDKLGVTSRARALMAALETGLIRVPVTG
jgi:DNA-binding NarL/FixJ family response regulator